jgi:hypothetical protein
MEFAVGNQTGVMANSNYVRTDLCAYMNIVFLLASQTMTASTLENVILAFVMGLHV